MKPTTIVLALRGLLALFEATVRAAPEPRAVAAFLRAISAESSRLASKIERNGLGP